MTNRSTWPSSDLWKRLAADALAENTACPACGCPAATHQRDIVAGAYFCPLQIDGPSDYSLPEVEAQRTKLWEMLKRATPGPNAFVPRRLVFMESMRKRAADELAAIERENPDFTELRPILSRIVSVEPTISMGAALERARTIMAQRKFMRGEEEKRRAPLMQKWMELAEKKSLEIKFDRVEMMRAAERQAAVQQRADRAATKRAKRAAAKVAGTPSEPPATVGTGKRKYNFDEDL